MGRQTLPFAIQPVECRDDASAPIGRAGKYAMKDDRDRRLGVDGLIVRLLADLARVGAEDADTLIDDAIGQLGQFAGADRCYVFQISDGTLMHNTHEWVAPGTEAVIDDLQNLPLDLMGPGLPAFWADEAFHLPDVEGWQTDAELKPVLMEQGIKAILMVPFHDENGLAGFTGFDNTQRAEAFDETVVYLLKSATDIIGTTLQRLKAEAKHKLIEEELRRTTQRISSIFQAIPEMIFELDGDRRYTGLATGQPEDMIVPIEERTGKHVNEVLPPFLANIVNRGVDVAETGHISEPERYELTLRGKRMWHELTVAPVGTPGSDEFRSIIIVRDVTDDEWSRGKLERLSQVARMMTNLVILTDADGNVLWSNPAFCKRSGYSSNEMKGKPLVDFTRSPNSDPKVGAKIGKAMAQQKPFRGVILNATRSGEEYWVDLNISAVTESVSGDTVLIHVATDITNQKSAQEDLAHFKELLESAIDALPDAFAYFDREDKLVICNERYREFYPKSADKIVPGVDFEELIRYGVAQGEYSDATGREEEWIEERLERHRNPGEPLEQALADGRWLQILEQPTSDGGRVGMRVDVTALKRAEDRLAGIIDGAEVGTWEWVRGQDEIAVNDRYSEMLGLPHEELDRRPVHAFIGMVVGEDRMQVAQNMEALLRGETEFFAAEFRMRHADGSAIWVETRGRVVTRSADGRPKRVSGVQMDITSRKASELALKKANTDLTEALTQRDAAERRFFDIASLSTDWFFEVDANLVHSYLSENFSKLADIEVADFIGRPLHDLRDLSRGPYSTNRNWKELQAAFSEEGGCHNFIFQATARDGSDRWLRLAATPITTRSGHITGYRGVGTDVTELYTERLKALQASEAKSLFLANMSHEIRTPLNGVLGMAELLAPTLTDDRQRSMISTIHSSGELLLSLLNNILDMSKIEAGKLEIVDAPFAPNVLGNEANEVYGALSRNKGVDFELTVNEGAQFGRLGDVHRLRQILHNLLNNAVKFTADGTVRLRVLAEPGAPVVFEVSDSGIGMTDEQVAVVFEAFQQADKTTSGQFGGTGLGLAVVRELVTLMKGEIKVESTPGVGTTIRIVLPLPEVELAEDTAETVEEDALATAENRFADRRVLLVDDSTTNLFVGRSMLEETGCDIVEATDGQTAIDQVTAAFDGPEADQFDIVLLDISMPHMDGLETIAHIRAAEKAQGRPPMPIIAVTANAMAHQVADYIVAGFDSYLAKPYRRVDLLEVMGAFLPQREEVEHDG